MSVSHTSHLIFDSWMIFPSQSLVTFQYASTAPEVTSTDTFNTLYFFFLQIHLNYIFAVFKIEVQLIYNVVSVSSVNQSDSDIHTHTHTHILFNILSHYGLS